MSDETHEEFISAERRLSVTLTSYEGKWVAVRDHEVVLSADTLDDLLWLACEQMGLADDVEHSVFQVPRFTPFFGASPACSPTKGAG